MRISATTLSVYGRRLAYVFWVLNGLIYYVLTGSLLARLIADLL